MRRLLPVFLCVAASTGLTACDQEPVSAPKTPEEQALFDAPRAAPFALPDLADGDVSLSRPAGGGGGGGADIVVFDILGVESRNANGTTIQVLSATTIASPDGVVLCNKTTSGAFTQLRDADGDVLFSSLGFFVFEGQPSLAGKNLFQQYQELASHLRFSYDFDVVVEGMANSGDDMVEATLPIQFASGWRKLVIASLVDGYCGSDGLPDA
jgi:hypothetical protein